MTIDAVDQKLLAALRENGRASTADLARRVGRSRTTVQSRIERLERDGIIMGYAVRLSPDHEHGAVRAHVMIKIAPKESRAVEAALRAIREVRVLHSVSGDFDMIDKTTIHDLARSQIPGAANAIVFNMECFWDPSDAGLAALAAASDIKAKRAVRITFADGSKYLFNGYVACAMAPQGSAQDLVTTPVTITVDGRGTFYSS